MSWWQNFFQFYPIVTKLLFTEYKLQWPRFWANSSPLSYSSVHLFDFISYFNSWLVWYSKFSEKFSAVALCEGEKQLNWSHYSLIIFSSAAFISHLHIFKYGKSKCVKCHVVLMGLISSHNMPNLNMQIRNKSYDSELKKKKKNQSVL